MADTATEAHATLARDTLNDGYSVVSITALALSTLDEVDLLQRWLDDNHEHPERQRQIRRLLDHATSHDDHLPRALFIHDVVYDETVGAIACGGYADVYKGTHKNQEVAVKQFRAFVSPEKRPKVYQRFCREALTWRQLKHPHILLFLGVDHHAYQQRSSIAMVSPWITHGTLMGFLHQAKDDAIDNGLIIKDIASGLGYLHAQSFAHGDLHSSNVFINNQHRAILADFGLTSFTESEFYGATTSNNNAGNLRWISPELISRDDQPPPRKTSEGDIFAFGRLCYCVYTRCIPFPEAGYTGLLIMVLANRHPDRPNVVECHGREISDRLWELILRCWSEDPGARPNIPEVVASLEELPVTERMTIGPSKIATCGSSAVSTQLTLTKVDLSSTLESASISPIINQREVVAPIKGCAPGGMVCAICGTTTTPYWRQDDVGNDICNACGLYSKPHGTNRPNTIDTGASDIQYRRCIPFQKTADPSNAATLSSSAVSARVTSTQVDPLSAPDSAMVWPIKTITKHDSETAGASEVRQQRDTPLRLEPRQCPQCSLKFHRLFLLKRHLKTHSAEIRHKCEQCESEFTRSDALSRHRRTCNGVYRSRRRSCAPCAESKIKCNRALPCDQCIRQEIFCSAVAPKRSHRTTASQSSTNVSSTSTTDGSAWHSQDTTSISNPSHSRDDADMQESEIMAPPLASMYQSNIFDPLFNGLFSSLSTNGQDTLEDHSQWVPPTTTEISTHPSSLASQSAWEDLVSHRSHAFQAELTELMDPRSTDPTFRFAEYDQTMPSPQSGYPIAAHERDDPPSSPQLVDGFTAYDYSSDEVRHDLDHYMHLFWSRFIPQITIMHGPTWNPGGKPDYLIAAMRAAGALYVRTRRAKQFIVNTVTAAQRHLSTKLATSVLDAQDQAWLLLSVVLLQVVEMYRPDTDSDSQTHQSFLQTRLAQMIRRYDVVRLNALWRQRKHHDAVSLQAAWLDWVEHEVTKRAIMLSLVHDCCRPIFFGLDPLFTLSEFDMNLPTDSEIWSAATADEWWEAQNCHSVYGWPELRVHGYPMQKALQALADSRRLDSLTNEALINPMAHWALIHVVLRNLFALGPDTAHPDRGGWYAGWGGADAETVSSSSTAANVAGADEATLRIQYVLHNWLESWLRMPESQAWRDGGQVPFMNDALPFYWLGQVSLLALQEGIPPFVPRSRFTSDERFRLMKRWLRHIRTFLRPGAHQPTMLWNEMMKIRLQGLDAHGHTQEDTDRLLDVFD